MGLSCTVHVSANTSVLSWFLPYLERVRPVSSYWWIHVLNVSWFGGEGFKDFMMFQVSEHRVKPEQLGFLWPVNLFSLL